MLEAAGGEVVADSGVQDAPLPRMKITIKDNNSFFTFRSSFPFYLCFYHINFFIPQPDLKRADILIIIIIRIVNCTCGLMPAMTSFS